MNYFCRNVSDISSYCLHSLWSWCVCYDKRWRQRRTNESTIDGYIKVRQMNYQCRFFQAFNVCIYSLSFYFFIYFLGYQSHWHLHGHKETSNFYCGWRHLHVRLSEYSHTLVEPPTHRMSAGRPYHMKIGRWIILYLSLLTAFKKRW